MTIRTAFAYSLLVNALLAGGFLFQRAVHAGEVERVLDEAREAEIVLLTHTYQEVTSGEPDRLEDLARMCSRQARAKQAYDDVLFDRKMASLR